ncbi:trafficking protein particle complex subunit 2 [Skeletonema marinoi]|uniref:Trafficking protein particle complex subunit 2 n=1 Tax=Skeletonema marinoi TaxID=267567 RepID=A0AAD8YND2_9STRA|nr:trafficking protein particle complex subunit 2 [Skeletonema marinoi]|mmetsp:Transcript_15049/g.30671  ORF Transcript_15049/g.30671 Transcript_15049/m.30671 type:complete len:139 (-) Transcript_15049:115-531(-)
MSTPILFVIVGKNEPLFEAEIDTTGASAGNDLSTRQNYFVLHSSLDLVEKSSWTTNNMYLRVVDKVNHQQVSTFLTAGNVKFMLLHGGKGEEVVKNFFNEVYGYFVKLSMNPFYKYDTPIASKAFDARVRAAARAYLS